MLSLRCPLKSGCARKIFRSATIFILLGAVSACATPGSANQQWAAHGYLTPDPSGEPELIGVFSSVKECETAADAWTSRQVVGNPVFAECYPVDQN